MSSREASLSLNAELLGVPWSDTPPSVTVTECGRDWDLCRGAVLLALSAEGENKGWVRVASWASRLRTWQEGLHLLDRLPSGNATAPPSHC